MTQVRYRYGSMQDLFKLTLATSFKAISLACNLKSFKFSYQLNNIRTNNFYLFALILTLIISFIPRQFNELDRRCSQPEKF